MPHEVGAPIPERAAVQAQDSVRVHLVHDLRPSFFARYLQARFERIERRDDDSPHRGHHRGAEGGDFHGSQVRVCRKYGPDAFIRGRVAESGQRSRQQGEGRALIEARDAALSVEFFECLGDGNAVLVLVVEDRPEPHEQHDLQDHGDEACGATPEGRSSCLGEDLSHLWWAGGRILLCARIGARFSSSSWDCGDCHRENL
mmetsp:Transcript_6755/g.18355  ORF Transcript_6755/g.18355 Transcript_6755/m.18355 type:complete len:201 (+) Transcript_6755:1406-2008(+)